MHNDVDPQFLHIKYKMYLLHGIPLVRSTFGHAAGNVVHKLAEPVNFCLTAVSKKQVSISCYIGCTCIYACMWVTWHKIYV